MFWVFSKGLRKMVIDCRIGPRAVHLGRAKKGLWEGLVRTSHQQVPPPLWDEAEEMGAPGMLQAAQSCCPCPTEDQQMLQGCSFLPEAQSTLCCAPRSLLHPQGPSQAGARADQGLPARKSTILKEKERSVKV